MASQKKDSKLGELRPFCLEPEIPDLPGHQLKKLHRLRDEINGFLRAETTIGGDPAKIDRRIALALLLIFAAQANHEIVEEAGSALGVGYGNAKAMDLMSKHVARTTFEAVDHNARIQVRYKKPKSNK